MKSKMISQYDYRIIIEFDKKGRLNKDYWLSLWRLKRKRNIRFLDQIVFELLHGHKLYYERVVEECQ